MSNNGKGSTPGANASEDVLYISTPPKKTTPRSKLPSKICVRCGKKKRLTDFFGNRQFVQQAYVDAWCKDCVNKHAVDKETMREYCWYNNRLWNELMWERAIKGAEYVVSTNGEYITAGKQKKEDLLNVAACNQYKRLMNLAAFYVYSPNMDNEGVYKDYKPESIDGVATHESDEALPDDEEVVYSAKWNGHYTFREVEYLDAYYDSLSQDYVLDTKNLRDYARKVAKASLAADLANNKYRRGSITSGELREAYNIFDTLSKSANFAACKRKGGDTLGTTSFSELAARLQATGKIETCPAVWEKDAVDVAQEYLRHVIVAMNVDSL